MPAWPAAWLASAGPLSMAAWRGVDAQHVVSTLRLVDTLDEQQALERLLDNSMPPLPARRGQRGHGVSAARQRDRRPQDRRLQATPHQAHPLLSSPFRYRPVHPSRFRRAGSHGVWYGAQELRTACAEIAYWRWRFLMDSAGLAQEALLTEHLLFQAQVRGPAIDLTIPPWSALRAQWTHPTDYSATQALAGALVGVLADALVDAPAIPWIRYESARDAGGVCAAALTIEALASVDLGSQQTWHCKTTRSAVMLVNGDSRFAWTF